MTIDIFNKQMVGGFGTGSTAKILVALPKQIMSKKEALVHAAWLVCLAEDEEGQFDEILQAVKNT